MHFQLPPTVIPGCPSRPDSPYKTEQIH